VNWFTVWRSFYYCQQSAFDCRSALEDQESELICFGKYPCELTRTVGSHRETRMNYDKSETKSLNIKPQKKLPGAR
jgi:hypothetical protein